MPIFRTLIAVIALLALASSNAAACSCAGPQEPCHAFNAEAVFVGTVVELTSVEHKTYWGDQERLYPGFRMRFHVEEAFRGVSGTEVLIDTGGGGGDCGTPYEPGTRLLIVANKTKDGALWTGLCSGNRILRVGSNDSVLKPYRDLAKRKGIGSIVGLVSFGSVHINADDSSIEEAFDNRTTKGVEVVAVSEKHTAVATSTEDGTFKLENLPNGKYIVAPRITLNFEYSHEHPENYVAEVRDGSCGTVAFRVFPATRIKGKVVRPPSAPDGPVQVVAIPTSVEEPSQFAGKWDYTGESDTFDLWPLVPGDYVLTVNVTKAPGPDSPYPPTYFPGVPDRASAAVIHVEEGQAVDLVFRLTELLSERKLKVRVKSATGDPPINAVVAVEDRAGSWGMMTSEVDHAGVADFTVLAGRSYNVRAQGLGNQSCSRTVEVKADPAAEETLIDVILDLANCD